MSKKDKIRDSFLEELRKIPIVAVACEKTNISRNSVYRWKKEDKKFCNDMEQALVEGEALVNDLSESQLLTLIKEKSWSAISFWLRHRNPKFKDKVEITTSIRVDDELTPEQEAVVKRALEIATLTNPNKENHDNRNTKDN